jgi:lipid A oxidase
MARTQKFPDPPSNLRHRDPMSVPTALAKGGAPRMHLQKPLHAMALATVLAGAPHATRADIELSFYGGPQTTHPSIIRSPGFGGDKVNWNSEPFVIPPYYGLRAKWWSEGRLGFGLDFFHAKAFADDPAALGFDELNFSHGLNVLTADLWYRLPPVGRVTPYLGAGLGVVVPHVEVRPTGGTPTANYQIAGPAATVVLGGALPVSRNWSVFTEYKATYSQIRARLDTGAPLDTNIFTDALNVGVTLRF